MRRLVALLVIVALLASACAVGPILSSPRPLAVPRGGYGGLVWLSANRLMALFLADPQEHVSNGALVALDPTTGASRDLKVAAADTCSHSMVAVVAPVWNGTVAFVLECDGKEWPPFFRQIRVVGGGAEGVEATTIAELDYWPSGVAWDPVSQSGWVSQSSGLCAGIQPFSTGGATPPKITFGAGDRTFSIDTRPDAPGECTNQPRADSPALAPAGDRLAFFGSPASAGKRGFDRADDLWNLYLADAKLGGQAQPLVVGIRQPLGQCWSPDGRAIVFTGGLNGRDGLWEVAATPGSTPIELADGLYYSCAWSPDGRQLVASRQHGDSSDFQDLVLLDLPSGAATGS